MLSSLEGSVDRLPHGFGHGARSTYEGAVNVNEDKWNHPLRLMTGKPMPSLEGYWFLATHRFRACRYFVRQ